MTYDPTKDGNHLMLRGCVLDYPFLSYAGKKSTDNSSLDFPPNDVIPVTFPGERLLPQSGQQFPIYFNNIAGQIMSVYTSFDEPIHSLRLKIFNRMVVALHVQQHEDDVDARFLEACGGPGYNDERRNKYENCVQRPIRVADAEVEDKEKGPKGPRDEIVETARRLHLAQRLEIGRPPNDPYANPAAAAAAGLPSAAPPLYLHPAPPAPAPAGPAYDETLRATGFLDAAHPDMPQICNPYASPGSWIPPNRTPRKPEELLLYYGTLRVDDSFADFGSGVNTGAKPKLVGSTLRTYGLMPGSTLRAQWLNFASEKILGAFERGEVDGADSAPPPGAAGGAASKGYSARDPAFYGNVNEAETALHRAKDTFFNPDFYVSSLEVIPANLLSLVKDPTEEPDADLRNPMLGRLVPMEDEVVGEGVKVKARASPQKPPEPVRLRPEVVDHARRLRERRAKSPPPLPAPLPGRAPPWVKDAPPLVESSYPRPQRLGAFQRDREYV